MSLPWISVAPDVLLVGVLASPPAAPAHATTTATACIESPAQPPARTFHLARASLELAGVIGLGIGWYEWQIELNKQDFDFARTGSDQWRRLALADGIRFDDNERYLNVGHAFIGAAYYDLARVNGASLWQSALVAFGTSTFWETAVEHREVLSINDEIITGVAGVPIGESLYQVGELFARSKPTWRNRLLMSLFSPTHVAAWAAGDLPEASGRYDEHDLDATTFHRFDLSLGATTGLAGGEATAQDRTWTAAARADLEVVSLPGFDQEGGASRIVGGGDMTRLVLSYSGSQHDMRSFDWFSRATLFGHYETAVSDTPVGPRGAGRFLGAASAFELSYEDAAGTEDFLTLAHLAGPAAEGWLVRGPWRFRLEGSAYGDFAMVQPEAVAPPDAPAVFAGAKSPLQRFDYYYGWGLTSALRLEVSRGLWRAGATAEWNHVGSIQGRDRHQEAYVSPTGVPHPAISNDAPLSDERGKVRAFAEVPVPFAGDVKLGASLEVTHRQGTFEDVSRAQTSSRVGVQLTYAL